MIVDNAEEVVVDRLPRLSGPGRSPGGESDYGLADHSRQAGLLEAMTRSMAQRTPAGTHCPGSNRAPWESTHLQQRPPSQPSAEIHAKPLDVTWLPLAGPPPRPVLAQRLSAA